MHVVCPHCGSQEGFYIKKQVRGTSITFYTNKGHFASENSQMYDGLTHSGGKKAFCKICDKYIGKSVDFISGLEEKVNLYGLPETSKGEY